MCLLSALRACGVCVRVRVCACVYVRVSSICVVSCVLCVL